MDTRKALALSLALSGLFLAAVVLNSLFFVPVGSRRIAAAPAAQARLLEGRDAADTELVEPMPGDLLDLNRADEEALEKLPGIGEALARAIVEYRQQHGPFRSAEELMLVDGIGESKYADVAQWIYVGDVS